MGSPIKLDEENLIQYFADGVSDFKQDRMVLCQAKNLDNPKDRLKM